MSSLATLAITFAILGLIGLILFLFLEKLEKMHHKIESRVDTVNDRLLDVMSQVAEVQDEVIKRHKKLLSKLGLKKVKKKGKVGQQVVDDLDPRL